MATKLFTPRAILKNDSLIPALFTEHNFKFSFPVSAVINSSFVYFGSLHETLLIFHTVIYVQGPSRNFPLEPTHCKGDTNVLKMFAILMANFYFLKIWTCRHDYFATNQFHPLKMLYVKAKYGKIEESYSDSPKQHPMSTFMIYEGAILCTLYTFDWKPFKSFQTSTPSFVYEGNSTAWRKTFTRSFFLRDVIFSPFNGFRFPSQELRFITSKL